jgi:hypothetical protein
VPRIRSKLHSIGGSDSGAVSACRPARVRSGDAGLDHLSAAKASSTAAGNPAGRAELRADRLMDGAFPHTVGCERCQCRLRLSEERRALRTP